MSGSSDVQDRVTSAELEAWLRGGDPPAVLDVRRREAWAAAPLRIPGARWLPLEEVPRRAADLPRERQVIVYCS